jgi:hypothetical protein
VVVFKGVVFCFEVKVVAVVEELLGDPREGLLESFDRGAAGAGVAVSEVWVEGGGLSARGFTTLLGSDRDSFLGEGTVGRTSGTGIFQGARSFRVCNSMSAGSEWFCVLAVFFGDSEVAVIGTVEAGEFGKVSAIAVQLILGLYSCSQDKPSTTFAEGCKWVTSKGITCSVPSAKTREVLTKSVILPEAAVEPSKSRRERGMGSGVTREGTEETKSRETKEFEAPQSIRTGMGLGEIDGTVTWSKNEVVETEKSGAYCPEIREAGEKHHIRRTDLRALRILLSR